MIIRTDLAFNRAGQGCFYTGIINAYENDFYFVYDCGTNSVRENLRNDIEYFRECLQGNKLDLLILSHFDADHVNEVKKLLEGIDCDTIIIPYLPQEERLFLLAMHYYDTDGDNPNPDFDQDYRLFILDPLSFFSSENFRIRQIVLVQGNADDVNQTNFESEGSPSARNERTENPIEIGLENSPQLSELVGKNEANGLRNTTNRGITTTFCSNRGHVNIAGIWYFKLFNLHQNTDKIARFNRALKRRLGTDHITADHIRRIFNEEFNSQINKNYKDIFESVNSTSIVVFHGPVYQGFALDLMVDNRHDHFNPFYWEEYYSPIRDINNCGTLLTGDIDCSGDKFNDIVTYFNSEIHKTLFFQVPHHGSKENWNRNILTVFTHVEFFIINSGLGNQPKHPAGTVVQEIYNQRHCGLILNNQVNPFTYCLFLRYP